MDDYTNERLFDTGFMTVVGLCTYLVNDSEIQYGRLVYSVEI